MIAVSRKVKQTLHLTILNDLGVNRGVIYAAYDDSNGLAVTALFGHKAVTSNNPFNPTFAVDPASDTYAMWYPTGLKDVATFPLSNPVFSSHEEGYIKVNTPNPLVLTEGVDNSYGLISPMSIFCHTIIWGKYVTCGGSVHKDAAWLKLYHDEDLVLALPFRFMSVGKRPAVALEDFADGDMSYNSEYKQTYLPPGTEIDHTFLMSVG